MSTISAITVEVCEGSIFWKHGRCWTAGDRLEVTPADADRMQRRGMVRVV